MKSLLKHTAFGIGLLLLPLSASAGTVTWGVDGQSATDFDFFGDGEILNDSQFSFELGFFRTEAGGQSFVPTVQNIAVWEENWVRVGDTSMYDPNTGVYGGQVTDVDFAAGTDVAGNTVGAESGARIYIWGFDSRDLSQPEEWVLYTGTGSGTSTSEGGMVGSGPTTLASTDLNSPTSPTNTNWVAPANSGNQGNFSLDWEPATADIAVIGRVPVSGDQPGDGEVENPQTLGPNTVQTATVPEPSSSVLVLLVGLGLGFIRRR